MSLFGPDGSFLSLLGERGDAPGAFMAPQSLAIHRDSGRLIVADTGNNRLQEFD